MTELSTNLFVYSWSMVKHSLSFYINLGRKKRKQSTLQTILLSNFRTQFLFCF